MDKEFKRSLMTTSVILITTIILLVTFSFGVILTDKSSAAMKKLMDDHMLSVSNTAAAMLSGDDVEKITNDKESKEYQRVFRTLTYFKDNIELDYIYVVKGTGNDSFIFVVDPDTDNPALYGEQIETTEALISASEGAATVDFEVISDRWGSFYSAYSPVYNSSGEVSGIVGVDFNADWYESQIRSLAMTSFKIGLFSLLMGAGVIVVINSRSRKNLRSVHRNLNELNDNIEELMREVGNIAAIESAEENKKSRYVYEEDDLETLGKKILFMQDELRDNIAIIREQAYIDAMTGARNKTAYLEDIKEIEKGMTSGNIDFSVIVFDMISLKQYNDDYGHEVGDKAINDAVGSLIEVFGRDNVYRVGGDEFVSILRFVTEDNIKRCFADLEQVLEKKNLEGGIYVKLPLGISKGYAVYKPAEDLSFNDVFRRADQMMYADKAAYYMKRGDRRRR